MKETQLIHQAVQVILDTFNWNAHQETHDQAMWLVEAKAYLLKAKNKLNQINGQPKEFK